LAGPVTWRSVGFSPGRLGRNVAGWTGQLEIGRVFTGSPGAKRRRLDRSTGDRSGFHQVRFSVTSSARPRRWRRRCGGRAGPAGQVLTEFAGPPEADLTEFAGPPEADLTEFRLGRNVAGWTGQLEIGRVFTGSPGAKRRRLDRSAGDRSGFHRVAWGETSLAGAGQLEIGRVFTGSPGAKHRPLQTSAVASALWRSMMPRRTALRTA
jgi:hypothetical protein